jgi:predicted ATP-binding protein involved in virulence
VEAQQAMEEAKRQEQARQAQAQRERAAIEQAEQKAAAMEKTGNLRGALNDYAAVLRQLEESSSAIKAVAPSDMDALGQRLRA